MLALGWAFELRPTAADETPQPHETPASMVRRLSEIKARHAAEDEGPGAFVIGSDTTVALEAHIIGKPVDAADATAMLKRLRGRTHDVFTGLTVFDTTTGHAHSDLARSRVPMRNYSDDELLAYVATGDPLDKAGAYAIQHAGFQPVAESFGDCFANVMGLPLCHLLRRLRALGLPPHADVPAACQRFLPYACPVFESILREPL
jgi:MAF protein